MRAVAPCRLADHVPMYCDWLRRRGRRPLPRTEDRMAASAAVSLTRALTCATALALLTTRAAAAQSSPERGLTIHGDLTEAFGKSSGLPIGGTTSTGRTDFRLLVLQMRYALNPDEEVVAQVRHRHFGGSLQSAIEPELTLSWAYYWRRMGPLDLKVGRVPLEVGIYSETRVVGTI